MAKKVSLTVRIALFMSLFVAALLSLAIALIGTRLDAGIRSLVSVENQQIASARAAEVGQILEKIFWQLRAVVASPALVEGAEDGVRTEVYAIKSVTPAEIISHLFAWPDGRAFTSTGAAVDVSGEPYFSALTSGETDFVVSDPTVSKANGLPGVTFAMAVKDSIGDFRGVVAYQMNLSQLSAVTGSVTIGASGYGWAVDRNGTVIAHPNPKAIMALNVTQADALGYKGLDAVGRAILAEETGSGEWAAPTAALGDDATVGGSGKYVRMTTYWVHVPGDSGWVMGLSVPTSELREEVDSLILLLLAVLAVGVAVSAAFSVAFARRIVAPLSLAAREFRELAEGEADLTRCLDVERNDEIGDLTRDFNSFLCKLSEIIGTLKAAQSRLDSIGEELVRSAAVASSEIQRMGSGIVEARDGAVRQENGAAESKGEADKIAAAIDRLDRLIEGQAAAIAESSSAIEQMVTNIGSVASVVDRMAVQFGELKGASDEGKATLAAAGERIAQIAERSKSLLEANQAIAGIASRTNLLAMNAAIEAAHAGAAGAGFSVVASEIRLLAESAAGQSKAIGRELKQVLQAIGEVVQGSRATESAFSAVADRIAQTDGLVREARDAMDEQRQGSSQVLEALREINDVSVRVKSGSREMSEENAALLAEIGRLREAAAQLRVKMDGLATGAAAIEESARGVSAAAEGTRETIRDMDGSIGRFKI